MPNVTSLYQEFLVFQEDRPNSISEAYIKEPMYAASMGAKAMKKILEDKKIFHFELQLEEDNYMQIELDEDGNRIYSENYKRIE